MLSTRGNKMEQAFFSDGIHEAEKFLQR